MDCGPSCLRMVAKFYGKNFSLQELGSKSFFGKSGVSMLGIREAAESIGFRTRGYRLTWEQLRDAVPLPCIIHWNQRHFVVVYEIKKGRKLSAWSFGHGAGSERHRAKSTESRIKVADPASGLLTYSEDEFLKCWYSTKSEGFQEGTALLLEPTQDFYRQEGEEKVKLKFFYLLNYIKPYSKYILQLMLGLLTASIISLIFPFLTQSLVDTGIGNSNMAFVVMVLVAQLILSLSQTANGLLQNWINLNVTSRVTILLISDFLIKLMKLPVSFSM